MQDPFDVSNERARHKRALPSSTGNPAIRLITVQVWTGGFASLSLNRFAQKVHQVATGVAYKCCASLADTCVRTCTSPTQPTFQENRVFKLAIVLGAICAYSTGAASAFCLYYFAVCSVQLSRPVCLVFYGVTTHCSRYGSELDWIRMSIQLSSPPCAAMAVVGRDVLTSLVAAFVWIAHSEQQEAEKYKALASIWLRTMRSHCSGALSGLCPRPMRLQRWCGRTRAAYMTL